MSSWFLCRWMGGVTVGALVGRATAQWPWMLALSMTVIAGVVYHVALTWIRIRYRWYGSRDHVS